ncbi:MAG: Ig-like domain-containing protein, partial [Oscillospiraceae bacterium]
WDSYNTYLNSKKEYKGYGLTYFDVTNQGFSTDHRTVVIPNTVELKKDNFTYIFDEGTIQLINYTGSDTKVTIPSIARSITTASFKSTISELTIGKNIVFIEPYAISKFTKIICYKNSYAHKYAVDNGYNFELISNDIEKLEITNAPSSLSVGEQLKLNIKISPLDAENKNLVFSSSDENIATIDNNGTITAKKKGKVTITVKTKDNLIFTSCNFNVKNIAISEIVVLNKSFSIEKDNTLQINTIITPENATNKTLIYESSNEDIATVDKNGLITAKEKGNAIIKIKSAEDNTQVTININVYIKGEEILIEKIQMDKTEYYLSVDDILNFKLTLTPSNATNTNVTF